MNMGPSPMREKCFLLVCVFALALSSAWADDLLTGRTKHRRFDGASSAFTAVSAPATRNGNGKPVDVVVKRSNKGSAFGTARLQGTNGTSAPPACTSAPPGLVGWWPGDGNYVDIQGRSNGAPSGGVSFAQGQIGQAFDFNGVNGAVAAPSSPATDITGDLTIEAWINPGSAARGYVVLKGNGNDHVNAYSLRYGDGNDQSLLLSVADGATGT